MKKLSLIFFSILLVSAASLFAQPDILWTKKTQKIFDIQFSKDDSKILTNGDAGIHIFDTQSSELLKTIPGPGMYNHDRSMILASVTDLDSLGKMYPCVKVYDSETYQIIKTIRLPLKDLYVELSRDNRILFAVNKGYEDYYFLDFNTGAILNEQHLPNTSMGACTYTYDNHLILEYLTLLEHGNSIGKVLFINNSTFIADDSISNFSTSKIALSPDGNLIAMQDWSSQSRAVVILDAHTHEVSKEIPGWGSSVTGMTFFS